MNYETVVKNIETSKTVTIAHVNEVIDGLLSAYDDELLESWGRLYQLMQLIQTAKKYNGDSDQFHNLAVTLARADQYDHACDILNIGLRYHQRSLDLLADFLAYAIKCNRMTEAKGYFDTLMCIERGKWNWRAYDFSIDYLLECLIRMEGTENLEGINACIDDLLENFKKYHKNDENAYFAAYSVAASRNDEELAILQLESVLKENIDLKAPKCAIKIAEHYFDRSQYDIAGEYIKRSKTYITTSQPSVEPGYVYMLSALCGMSKLYTIGIDTLERSKIEAYVRPIYKDCEAASEIYRRNKFSRYKNLEMQRDILERLSGIPYSGE